LSIYTRQLPSRRSPTRWSTPIDHLHYQYTIDSQLNTHLTIAVRRLLRARLAVQLQRGGVLQSLPRLMNRRKLQRALLALREREVLRLVGVALQEQSPSRLAHVRELGRLVVQLKYEEVSLADAAAVFFRRVPLIARQSRYIGMTQAGPRSPATSEAAYAVRCGFQWCVKSFARSQRSWLASRTNRFRTASAPPCSSPLGRALLLPPSSR